jgi:hypothetical protein
MQIKNSLNQTNRGSIAIDTEKEQGQNAAEEKE